MATLIPFYFNGIMSVYGHFSRNPVFYLTSKVQRSVSFGGEL